MLKNMIGRGWRGLRGGRKKYQCSKQQLLKYEDDHG